MGASPSDLSPRRLPPLAARRRQLPKHLPTPHLPRTGRDLLSSLPAELLDEIALWYLYDILSTLWGAGSPWYISPQEDDEEEGVHMDTIDHPKAAHLHEARSNYWYPRVVRYGSTLSQFTCGLLAASRFLNTVCSRVLWRNFSVSFEWRYVLKQPVFRAPIDMVSFLRYCRLFIDLNSDDFKLATDGMESFARNIFNMLRRFKQLWGFQVVFRNHLNTQVSRGPKSFRVFSEGAMLDLMVKMAHQERQHHPLLEGFQFAFSGSGMSRTCRLRKPPAACAPRVDGLPPGAARSTASA